jgi:hypothetical protein
MDAPRESAALYHFVSAESREADKPSRRRYQRWCPRGPVFRFRQIQGSTAIGSPLDELLKCTATATPIAVCSAASETAVSTHCDPGTKAASAHPQLLARDEQLAFKTLLNAWVLLTASQTDYMSRQIVSEFAHRDQTVVVRIPVLTQRVE